MISYEVLADQGILLIEPSAPLQKIDFENLTRDVDAYLAKQGVLKGLIIHAGKFPGWEDFGAFLGHMRFVKAHHEKISRVAAVTDGKVLSLLPKLLNHFVSAEVKHFDYEEMEAAKNWILEA